jgi:hypothetical protein
MVAPRLGEHVVDQVAARSPYLDPLRHVAHQLSVAIVHLGLNETVPCLSAHWDHSSSLAMCWRGPRCASEEGSHIGMNPYLRELEVP